MAQGVGSGAVGNGTIALGQQAMALASNAVAVGTNATASDTNATAVGNGTSATAVQSTAVGSGATASQVNSTAVGTGAQAAGTGGTAVGSGASVAAGTTNSSAFGAGATATLTSQMVFGTGYTTYTAPGMDSDLSRSRQMGLLGVVTSDAFGNLASDNGALYKEVARVKSGTAVAMALADPSLKGTEIFWVKINWGGFDGANAVGVSTVGVLANNLFLQGDRLTITGAAGWGEATISGYNSSVAGGRAGIQLTW